MSKNVHVLLIGTIICVSIGHSIKKKFDMVQFLHLLLTKSPFLLSEHMFCISSVT